ncbi:hypothetical protein DUI87_13512 [Hirundo rustica rustica]|uniref:ribonuclease H n=1 Tax=Hirundo rustica rustica TaxID=333673 RepID=A0A3M0K9E3_HIRRU|nr:hypothetical protein DUI87_13512 [Hirundo rustica rustica]
MRRHTTLDPGSDEGTQQLINLFLGQSTGDIRRKLQKILGPNSRNLESLLDEAWRVFSNREEGYKQGMKKLATVVKEGEKGKHGQGPPKQGPPRLGKDQCAFCKKFGHWKNQCPELRKDLKDAFFCLPLHEASQKIFAFEWESPKTGRKTQLTWCVLPQGSKNSPTIFGEQLAKDLESWEPPPGEGQLLQYVDDLLIATRTQETCVDWTVSLLNFLGLQGYRVSQKKAQMVRQTVIYLGYEDFQTGCTGEPVIHDCLETIEATYWSCPDLNDTPLEDAETWFTDGSSYVVSGRRHAGYAVTTSREVIESGPLPTNTSAQKAEIIALIRALELAKGKEINIYTDSRYAFGVVHAHGAIWKERGLLNSQGKSIKHAQEILRLLDAIQLPERVAVMHIKAHQKVSSELEEGNMLADREAKEAAKGEVPDKAVEAALIPDGKVSIEGKPVYNKKDKKLIKVCTEYHKNQTKITPPVPRKAVITKMPAIPEVEEQITPVVTKIGPYAIKKTGVQKLIVNPKWSLKRVEMGVQGVLRHNCGCNQCLPQLSGKVEKEYSLLKFAKLSGIMPLIWRGNFSPGGCWSISPITL